MPKDIQYQIACLTTAKVFSLFFSSKELSQFTLKGRETKMLGSS